ncbi:MAG: hypothetical protein M1170_01155 [Patescibacteria group bacterium]|nr:hypothetical protein [Patescibacteria group bacterium]
MNMENPNNKENIKEEEDGQLELVPEYKLSDEEIREALKESDFYQDTDEEEIKELIETIKNSGKK